MYANIPRIILQCQINRLSAKIPNATPEAQKSIALALATLQQEIDGKHMEGDRNG